MDTDVLVRINAKRNRPRRLVLEAANTPAPTHAKKLIKSAARVLVAPAVGTAKMNRIRDTFALAILAFMFPELPIVRMMVRMAKDAISDMQRVDRQL